MLYLLDDKGNEQFERLSDFKRYVLDSLVNKINQRTDLEID
ncbi:hypothetical protein [Spirosoma endophyticum]|uniref:Uncharacterized protein n=1 Tax=Spirosoma endophyticum TaxID=662367 RepID=A0A1I2BE72_9BACT|nr:hypothetical protein [Spirosoma endophyticum]SFE54464.1 hypothetical protein SAMN05216167_11577 [Spirosoma endophyticum]